MARMVEAENTFGAQNVLSIPEMMDALTSSVWSEIWGAQPRKIPSMRRNVQRAYVDRMTQILTRPPARMPADARSVARMQLRDLQTRIGNALASGASLDAYTKAHLTEVREYIGKALDADLTVELLGGRG
jgi:hypothetical protein